MSSERFASIVDLLENSFRKNKDRIAIIENNKNYTYNDLNKMTEMAVNVIIKENLEGKSIVLYVDKSIEFIALVIAIWKTGGAYIPIDTEMPKDRINYIIENVEADCIVSDEYSKYNFDQNLRNYLKRIKRKTAVLIAASCQLGAISAGVSEDIHRKLFLFGYYVGMSYQIMDDVLDFTASEKELGKPAGSDLWQGNITLPVLLALQQPQLANHIRTVHEGMSLEELKPILKSIISSGSIEKSIDLSNAYLDKAFAILELLPESRNTDYLYEIAKFIGKRKY